MTEAKEGGCAVVVGVGAREGVGGAVAVLAARQGLHVFIAGRTAAKLARIVKEIESEGGRATAVVLDSTRAEDINKLFEQVSATGAPLQFVVYNTGRNIPAPFMQQKT